MMLTMCVSDIRNYFINELSDAQSGQEGIYEKDKTGMKTIEMISASFMADEPAIFGTPSESYIGDEIRWYESQSTNIYDINPDNEPPEAWKYSANQNGEINSNYGHLIFSDKYYSQMEKAIKELKNNPHSRRACIVYNRPSIWTEFNENGKNDFICTNAVTYYIRNDELQSVVQMRSNDVVFGYKNDYAWQRYVMDLMSKELNIASGFLHWQVQNLHVYERHFHLVK